MKWGDNLEFRRLRYFESVVKNKTFSKAAEELHISQPSLSAQIKTLEQMVGCKLLERNSREVSPTEAGKILYKHTCNLLLQVENISKEMEEVIKIESGEIKIGLFPSAAVWFPRVIGQLKELYPNFSIKIFETGAEDIETLLLNYDIHLGITSKLIASNKLSFIPIYNEELLLITHRNHRLKDLHQIDLSELVNDSFIQYKPGYQLREIILDSCLDAGFEPLVISECSRLETILNLVLTEIGVAIAPENYIKSANLTDLHIINIKNPTPSRTLYLVFNKDRYYQPIINDLKDLIIEYFDELPIL